MNTEIVPEENTTDTRLIPLRAHDAAIAKLQPALQYDTATDPKVVDRARKDAKAVRCAIENARKQLTADALAWQREVKAVADNIVARVTPIEEHCERIEAQHAAEKHRKAEEAAKAERARITALRIAEADALQISDRGKQRVYSGLLLHATLDTAEQWQERMAAAAKIDEILAAEDAAAAEREAEQARLQAEREELARQRAEIEAERKRLADEQAKQRAEELAKRQAEEAEARRIAAEEWQRKLAQSQREEAEQKERNAKDQQTRYAANAKAKRVIDIFVETVQNKRPSRETDGIGEYLDQMITAGIDLMAKYFEDQFRDHYDARADK